MSEYRTTGTLDIIRKGQGDALIMLRKTGLSETDYD